MQEKQPGGQKVAGRTPGEILIPKHIGSHISNDLHVGNDADVDGNNAADGDNNADGDNDADGYNTVDCDNNNMNAGEGEPAKTKSSLP